MSTKFHVVVTGNDDVSIVFGRKPNREHATPVLCRHTMRYVFENSFTRRQQNWGL